MTYLYSFFFTVLLSCSSTYATLHTEIERNFTEQLEFTKKIVGINSGTGNEQGIHQIAEIIQQKFSEMEFDYSYDKHLFFEKTGSKGKKILLIGHLDTVYGPESSFQSLTQQKNKIVGPGVYDMKGGIGVLLYALKALHNLNLLNDVQITVALMSDEESPSLPYSESRKELIQAAKKSDIALGLEYGQSLNKVVTCRRGVMDWHLKINAKSGHSSRIFSKEMGEGAIFIAAEILTRWREALKEIPHLTFNPGKITGGTKTNVIASNVEIWGDLRYHSYEAMNEAMQLMLSIAENQTGTSLQFDKDYYPPMEESPENLALLKKLNAVHKKMGLAKATPYTLLERGAADTCFVAHLLPTIDGLGAIGGRAHSAGQEYMSIEKTKLATERCARLLLALLNSN